MEVYFVTWDFSSRRGLRRPRTYLARWRKQLSEPLNLSLRTQIPAGLGLGVLGGAAGWGSEVCCSLSAFGHGGPCLREHWELAAAADTLVQAWRDSREWRGLWRTGDQMPMVTAQLQLLGSIGEHRPHAPRADFSRKAVRSDFHVKPPNFAVVTITISV